MATKRGEKQLELALLWPIIIYIQWLWISILFLLNKYKLFDTNYVLVLIKNARSVCAIPAITGNCIR